MPKENKLLIILVFNLFIMALETAGGIFSGSLALLGDAGHMLTDSLAIFLSYLAIKWSQKPATAQKTFGYHRTEVLAALVNGLTLLLVSGYIFYEAVRRMFYPAQINTGILLVIAIIGFFGNIAGMLMLKSHSRENINVRSAFFHMLGDTLSSIGVITGAIIIALTGWNIVDSFIGILIGGIVLRGAIDLVFESSEVLLESAPRDIDIEFLRKEVEKIPGIRELHEIHVWTITSGRRALSGHLLVDNISTQESQKLVCQARETLRNKFNITHTTLEVECEACSDSICEFGNHEMRV